MQTTVLTRRTKTKKQNTQKVTEGSGGDRTKSENQHIYGRFGTMIVKTAITQRERTEENNIKYRNRRRKRREDRKKKKDSDGRKRSGASRTHSRVNQEQSRYPELLRK